MSTPKLAEQYDAEVYTGDLSGIPSTVVSLTDGTKMLSLKQLATNIASMFKTWIDFTQDITAGSSVSGGGPSISKGIDLLPCRMQLIKTTTHWDPQSTHLLQSANSAHEVEYDDIEFGDSKVDVAAYTSVKLHNVTPASGNVLLQSDPMGSDNITHVPLKGKMYVFSGPTPKVWDKHRSDLQHLFKPEFFRGGRYLLPNSKLHSTQTEEFRTPPRGRFIWSNCVDEHKITMAPGGMQELKLNYRVKTSIKDFWYKYRDDDLSSSKLGRSICVCLEPSMRRMHINTPIPVVLVKEQYVPIGGSSPYYTTTTRNIPVEYQPYEWKRDVATGITTKQIRQVVTLGAVTTPTAITVDHPATAGALVSPTTYAHPGVVATIPWYVDSAGLSTTVVTATKLMWDKVTSEIIADNKQLQSFVSRGDPLMFNVQINRNYGASCALRNTVRLGADKTGVKRKYDDKMVNNMGDLDGDGDVDDDDWAVGRAAGDVFHDHELETATQAGVRKLVLEGDAENTVLPSGLTDTGIGVAVGDAVASAMDTDTVKAGVQLDISQLDGLLNTGGTALKVEETNATLVNTLLASNVIHTNANAIAIAADVGIAANTAAAVAGSVQLAALNATGVAATAAITAGTAELTALNVSAAAGVVSLDAATVAAGAGTAAVNALTTATGGLGLAVAANTGVVAALDVTILGKSFAPTNTTNNVTNNNDNTTTSNITVGATAAQIATAIAGQTLNVTLPVDAQGFQVPLSVTETAPVAHPTHMSVTETAPVASVSVSNHPTSTTITGSVNVINAPNTLLGVRESAPVTSVDTFMAAGEANAIAAAIAAQTLSVTETAPVAHPTHMSVTETHPVAHPTTIAISGTVPVSIAGTVAVSGTSGGLAAGDATDIASAILANTRLYGVVQHTEFWSHTPTTIDAWQIYGDDNVAYSGQVINLPAITALPNTLEMSKSYAGRRVMLTSGTTWTMTTDTTLYTTSLIAQAGQFTGVITEFPNYVGSNVYNGWTIRRDDGMLLTNQFFTKVNNSSANGQDFLLHNGKRVQFQGGTNWQEIRMA